jgi:hypothetical protein
MAALPRIDARIRFADAPVRSADRKELARTLWASANSAFAPIRQS